MKLSGCLTALITPFGKNLDVDYEGLRANVRFQIENSVSGLVLLGTTGESPVVNDAEREKIISSVVDESNGKVPVIVGTGTSSTERTLNYTKQAKELGADAVLVVSPYYNKPTQEGLYRHFKAVNDSVDIPIVVYNIQGRTGVNIETPTMVRMAGLKNIFAVKESSGSMSQVMDVMDQIPSLNVLSGDDNMTLPVIALGGKGVISVVSNLLPKAVSGFVSKALKGDYDSARNLHYRLLPVFKAAFIETNPIPIKAAMNLAGMAAGPVRMPLCEMQPQNLEKLEAVLKNYEELKIK